MMWQAVKSIVPYLTEQVRQRQLEYVKVVSGIESHGPRWEKCVIDLLSRDNRLTIAASALWVKHNFDKSSKPIATEMVHAIQDEFKLTLQTLDWMDVETRRSALKKIEKMEVHVGYPAELLDEKLLDEYYANLTLNNQYLSSHLQMIRFNTMKKMEKFRQTVNKTEWDQHSNAIIVNAGHLAHQNSIGNFSKITSYYLTIYLRTDTQKFVFLNLFISQKF